MLKQKSYNQQFSHIYVSRLLYLRDAVSRCIQETGGDDAPAVLPKIIDLKDGHECIIIGTLLKVLGRKPDIFKALSSEEGLATIEASGACLATDDDELVLEDESGRVQLLGESVDVGRLVTGVVLGVRGRMLDSKNGFQVDHVYYPEFPPQLALPERTESEYVALVSGLSLGRNTDSKPLRNHVLMDYLAGRIGNDDEKQFVAQIVRTVFVGNSIDSSVSSAAHDRATKPTSEELISDAAPMKNLDELVSSLACCMPVDIMPGDSDPSNYTMPQQSFHRCLFPQSARFTSFRAVTNPYEAQVGGVQFYGHAGQPVRSMLQCMLPKATHADGEENGDSQEAGHSSEDALDCLEQCLRWRHSALTAPDLLACFPMANEDPFIMESCPHVLFAGNQSEFNTRVVKGKFGNVLRYDTE